MGWTNSPPIFSTATETIADLANKRLNSNTTLAPHHLDNLAQSIPSPPPLCHLVTPLDLTRDTASPSPATSSPLVTPLDLTRDTASPLVTPSDLTRNSSPRPLVTPPIVGPTRDPSLPTSQKPLAYANVFVDDFVGAAQAPQPHLHNQATECQDPDLDNHRRIRRALLHAIDDVFQTLLPSENPTRQEPVSLKKLQEGDCSFGTLKLILGWIIDTINMTIQLPPHRVD